MAEEEPKKDDEFKKQSEDFRKKMEESNAKFREQVQKDTQEAIDRVRRETHPTQPTPTGQRTSWNNLLAGILLGAVIAAALLATFWPRTQATPATVVQPATKQASQPAPAAVQQQQPAVQQPFVPQAAARIISNDPNSQFRVVYEANGRIWQDAIKNGNPPYQVTFVAPVSGNRLFMGVNASLWKINPGGKDGLLAQASNSVPVVIEQGVTYKVNGGGVNGGFSLEVR